MASPPWVRSTRYAGPPATSTTSTRHGRARSPGDGEVAADPDQHRPAEARVHPPGGLVGGPGLRGRAEVEAQARRHADPAELAVDRAPPTSPPRRRRRAPLGAAAPRTCVDVVVVPRVEQVRPDRRVDGAVGPPRGVEGHVDQVAG